MDRTLKSLVSSLASNLLSTSTQFEPYVPNSKQNLYYSLNLLSGLGELARISLETEYPQSCAESSTPQQSPPPPVLQSKASLGSSRDRSKEVDQSLLRALQTLRESKQFQRKTMGVFSPILRGTT